MELNIKDDKILKKKVKYVCKQMKLSVLSPLKDEVGIFAYVLKDNSNRKYAFACKRYIDWSPKSYGRVSFTKELVIRAVNHEWTLIMLIEEKENEESRDYIYTFNPIQILETGTDNTFNEQLMINFNIDLALNMELTRRREILEQRVYFEKGNQKDRMNLSITRFLRS